MGKSKSCFSEKKQSVVGYFAIAQFHQDTFSYYICNYYHIITTKYERVHCNMDKFPPVWEGVPRGRGIFILSTVTIYGFTEGLSRNSYCACTCQLVLSHFNVVIRRMY